MKSPLYLASQSPRRKELLAGAGTRFEVFVPKKEEKKAPQIVKNEALAVKLVKSIAEGKAKSTYEELLEIGKTEGLILSADTLVFAGKEVLSKPKNPVDAARMLKKLSGKTHLVITAVSFLSFTGAKKKTKSIAVKTKVRFRKISKAELTWYLNTPEPYDKAGAYGAQGMGAAFIAKIEGSYTNVVGLPLAETLQILDEFFHAPWQNLGR